MHHQGLRTVGLATLGLLAVFAVGCQAPVLRLKIENTCEQSLTSVRMIPFYEDATLQGEAFAEATNLLPEDANGNILPLKSNETHLAYWFPRTDIAHVEVTAFFNGVTFTSLFMNEVDVSAVPRNALLTMQVTGSAAPDRDDLSLHFTYQP